MTSACLGVKLYLVEESRKILIVADDDARSQGMAQCIAAVVKPPMFEGCSVSVMKADAFYGTDILPAHAFFIGCVAPSPPSFTYIEMLFERINLAGRPCGVFSCAPKALRYLSGLVGASEASMGKPLLAKSGAADEAKLREWVRRILETEKRQWAS